MPRHAITSPFDSIDMVTVIIKVVDLLTPYATEFVLGLVTKALKASVLCNSKKAKIV